MGTIGAVRKIQLQVSRISSINQEDSCKHWACNAHTKRCVGCGVKVCPNCLKEPTDCKCENNDICCS